MQLTMQTDYALRVLVYLATHADGLVSAASIADAYGISREHVGKVAKRLVSDGYLRAQRGVGGGVALAKVPMDIGVGEIVRKYEPHLHLLPCFDRQTDTCPISPACILKATLFEARAAFFRVLDEKTIADLTRNAPELGGLLLSKPKLRPTAATRARAPTT